MKIIAVGKHEVIVDDWNYDRFKDLKMHATSGAVTVYHGHRTRRINIPLSKIIIMTDAPMVDHKDRNWLNFQVSNLRPCNKSQNQANHGKHIGSHGRQTTSQYKGVSWSDRDQTWSVAVGKGSSRKRGNFKDEITAALTYDRWATERWGEFACLNFQKGDQ